MPEQSQLPMWPTNDSGDEGATRASMPEGTPDGAPANWGEGADAGALPPLWATGLNTWQPFEPTQINAGLPALPLHVGDELEPGWSEQPTAPSMQSLAAQEPVAAAPFIIPADAAVARRAAPGYAPRYGGVGDRLRRASRETQLGLGCVSLLSLLLIALAAVVAASGFASFSSLGGHPQTPPNIHAAPYSTATATAKPTLAPAPTVAPKKQPTATATPKPHPSPTATPQPTATPAPTQPPTPAPTATPPPTPTPLPTSPPTPAPAPTGTAIPAQTPTPAPTSTTTAPGATSPTATATPTSVPSPTATSAS